MWCCDVMCICRSATTGDLAIDPGASFQGMFQLFQYNNPGANATNSQNFEPAFDPYDDELTDDFVNPGPDTWTVQQVEIDGIYFNGVPSPGGPATSVNIVFYYSAGTQPGSILASRPAQAYSGTLGDFVITLSSPVSIPPGTYWMSVQVNMDYINDSQNPIKARRARDIVTLRGWVGR